jgi:rfaE bifunctional protein kinase chain/domain
MKNKKLVVLVSGHFNILHPGHQRLLKFAKEAGQKLIVAVESDRLSGDAAHISEVLRLEGIKSCLYVDDAFINDNDIVDVIREIKPDIVVKGKEFENRTNRELEILSQYGGKLLFSSGDSRFSSLDLIRQESIEVSPINLMRATSFISRNSINLEEMRNITDRFGSLRVVVIGDLIVDEYITCEPLGMSQEDPTIVVTPVDSSLFIGGAGIVAAHAAGLGASVDFISVTGDDVLSKFSNEKFKAYGVKAHLLKDVSRPTTLKQRFRCHGKSLLRVSQFREAGISSELQNEMLNILNSVLPSADLLVFSDFNYGCLPLLFISEIMRIAHEHNVLTVADSQSSSQIGDISRFVGVHLITPTEREARIAMRDNESGLVVLAENLLSQTKTKNIILKMGEEGLLIYGHSKDGQIITDQVPALNTNPRDVAGAGDSLLVASSLAIASGANIADAAYLGSVAAAIQVGRMGNMPITAFEFKQYLNKNRSQVDD